MGCLACARRRFGFSVLLVVCSQYSLVAADETVAERISPSELIDQQVAQVWSAYQMSPSQPATEGEWCRRVYLDVLGRIPTVKELRTYVRNRSSDKREELVRTLLYDDAYTDAFARNWSTIWTNLLIGRTGGTQNNSAISRPGMSKYLRDSFARNKSYDRMAYELVSATGTTTPGDEKFNGATNFLIDKLDEQGIQATAKTAQVFLGMQVQCTQCHNHPFNEWKQNQFWELNAFFRQTFARRGRANRMQTSQLDNRDYAGEGSSPDEAESYYELRNGLLKTAYPVFVDGVALENRSGYLKDVNRREELATRIRQSDQLGKAIVNRMWAHFFGYGFTKPVDDMGPHNPPTHPELLDQLAVEFRDNSFDLRLLMRWILLSEPYGLSSRTTKLNAADDPQLGETPKFTHFYLRQMRAEELYESLLVATAADRAQGSDEDRERTRNQWLRQFSVAFGTDEGDETTTFNGTIPQALMMFNGELIRRATSLKSDSLLADVIASNKRAPEKIEHLFLAALARRPTKTELQGANRLLAARIADNARAEGIGRRSGRRDSRQPRANGKSVHPEHAALQDIWWAVLNSNEFILNH